MEQVKEEVVRSLNLFLAHQTFADEMGGRPRRGLLFEGAPGTGKTLLAKAMAAEAGVPFLFVSATAFQSMFYGATARKIRSYFKVLRKTAEREGGAIGFIEEIDAIAGVRGGMERAGFSADAARGGPRHLVVPTELLLQRPAGRTGRSDRRRHRRQPERHDLRGHRRRGQRAARPDAVLRHPDRHAEGRRQRHRDAQRLPAAAPAAVASRSRSRPTCCSSRRPTAPTRSTRRCCVPAASTAGSTFGLPGKSARRALIDHYLDRKAHIAELDDPERRDALAAVSQGYSPAKLEHLLDEGLVNAVRRGERAMSWNDVERARLTTEVGLGMPVEYTDAERRLIATHEAGHATVAHLVAPQRRLEVLTIIKRGEALGLLAHGDRDDVYTRSRTELLSMIQIAMGGQVAEELFFGDISTGPAGDLAYATQVAAQMVGAGRAWRARSSRSPPSRRASAARTWSAGCSATATPAPRSRRCSHEQKAIVRELLGRNRHLVEALRDGAARARGADRLRDHRHARRPPPRHRRVVDLRESEGVHA